MCGQKRYRDGMEMGRDETCMICGNFNVQYVWKRGRRDWKRGASLIFFSLLSFFFFMFFDFFFFYGYLPYHALHFRL